MFKITVKLQKIFRFVLFYSYYMKNLLLSSLLILCSSVLFAQYGYRDSNRIGIIAGVNQFSLNTNNFDTKPELGWNAGLSIRGNFYNDLDMVYALQFSENNFSVPTVGVGFKDVSYKLASAQISLQLSYKIIENHLSVEFGPIVQVNGKLRATLEVEPNISQDEILKMAKSDENVAKHLVGTLVKEIYVPGKIVNFVVKA